MTKQSTKIDEAKKALVAMGIGGAGMAKYEGLFEGYSKEEIDEMMGNTGTEEFPEGERRLAMIGWNLDTQTDSGVVVKPELFFNFQTEEQYESITCALVSIKRTRDFSYYDEETRKKVRVCRSYDMNVGQIVETGELRKCNVCPYRQSQPGKRKKCTQQIRFVAYDLERDSLFNVVANRSSFVPFSNYLEKTFFGQLKFGNKRADIPLYVLATQITLKPDRSSGRTYYVPVLECLGPISSKETVMALKETADAVKQHSKAIFQNEAPDNAEYLNNEQDSEPPPISDDDIPF